MNAKWCLSSKGACARARTRVARDARRGGHQKVLELEELKTVIRYLPTYIRTNIDENIDIIETEMALVLLEKGGCVLVG